MASNTGSITDPTTDLDPYGRDDLFYEDESGYFLWPQVEGWSGDAFDSSQAQAVLYMVDRAVAAERERWTEAARKHAGAWMLFATPDANVIAHDYLMWAATMQPVDADGMRPFKLAPLGGDHAG